ncbi:aminoglycoside phosphotransferase family protein [Pleomorphomonas sp. JP5]|uniref:aminoglycoside phosphotransferase family protein n=1 Tax=Pleomorphomonas sp. JP5 TaxID=2942998 RepID=UPI0020449752|nr:aminoglycoside phosphotransferase family protein [Pleomorphomonas sp. JP5]MCM5557509.1 phosphotransferase [Pleomorphomonas sp. JP5]
MTRLATTRLSLADAVTCWALIDPVFAAETATSVIYRATAAAHGPVALKLLKPGAGDDEARGGAMLAWFGGNGAARVFGLAPDAVLMEWLDGETLGDVARAGRDDAATLILADVVERLHARRDAPPPELTPLRRRFASLFRTDPQRWPADARPLVARATAIAEALLDADAPATPLHGDIHHDNILRSGDNWLAIDPKGLLGDPAYDYANSFQNPERADALVLDAGRIARHATALAERTAIPRRHLLAWAVAHTALSGAWNIEDGAPFAHQAAMLALLLAEHEAG